MSAEIGQEAPDFSLPNQFGEKVSLSDFRGKKNVVLVFYPFAFSGICTGELCTIRDEAPAFVNEDTQVIGISCDTKQVLRAFADRDNYDFPLLSDFWPHGATAKAYGIFMDEIGVAKRGTFIIDKAGVLRWAVINGPGEARDSADYRAALAELV